MIYVLPKEAFKDLVVAEFEDVESARADALDRAQKTGQEVVIVKGLKEVVLTFAERDYV